MTIIRRMLWVSVLALPLAFAGGCIMHAAADTVLSVRINDPDGMGIESVETLFGLADVLWRGGENSYEIVGHGWRPREHETYMIVANEGYPAGVDRFIHITPDGPPEEWPDYHVELVVPAALVIPNTPDPQAVLVFTGTLSPPHKAFPDRLQFSLTREPLSTESGPIRTIYVSGKIIATPAEDPVFDEMVESYRQAVRQRR